MTRGTAFSVARVLALHQADAAEVAGAVVTVVAARPELAVSCGVADGAALVRQAAPLALRHVGAAPHPRLLAELADEPFDLATGPLLRAVVFDGTLLLVASEFVADTDSLGLLMRDVQAVLAGGEPAPAVTRAGERDDMPSAAAARLGRSPYAGRRFVRRLHDDQVAAADKLADRLGTCRADVYLAVYAVTCQQLTDRHAAGRPFAGRDDAGRHVAVRPVPGPPVARAQNDLVIGVVARRQDAGDAVGPYSPVLPLQLEVTKAVSLLQLVTDVAAARSAATGSPASGAAAAGTMTAIFEDGDDGLPGLPVFDGRTSARADIGLVVLPAGLGWEFSDAFSDEEAAVIATAFQAALSAGLAAPEQPFPVTAAGALR